MRPRLNQPGDPPMNTVNMFTRYVQREADLTNSLVAVLDLFRFDAPHMFTSFLIDELGLAPTGKIDTFGVLQGVRGTPNGELCGDDLLIQFETKIVSGALDAEQIEHLVAQLRARTEAVRRLVLVTPDNSRSLYVQQFCSRGSDILVHLGWQQVHDFLHSSVRYRAPRTFSEVVRQFLDRIRDVVFEHDLAAVIQKIVFGARSGVYEDRYVEELKTGIRNQWNTPSECKSLDGTGRKLLLYDRVRRGITAEVVVEKVSSTDTDSDYRWANQFAPGTLRILDPVIPLTCIRRVDGLEEYGVQRRDRRPYRKLTHEQYRKLVAGRAREKQRGESACR